MYSGKTIRFADGKIGLILNNGTRGKILMRNNKGASIIYFMSTGSSCEYLIVDGLSPFLESTVLYNVLVGDTKGWIRESAIKYLLNM